MEIVKFYLLTNKKYYQISRGALMRDFLEYSPRITQFDLLYKDKSGVYYVEYAAEPFEKELDALRHNDTEAIIDGISYDIFYYLMNGDDIGGHKWMRSYMCHDEVRDRLINIYLVSTGELYPILYSTLRRFPNSIWCQEAEGKFSQDDYLYVDLNVDIFNWIVNLYRGVNHPLTFKTSEDIDTKYSSLGRLLVDLKLPDNILGYRDILYITGYCKKCNFIYDNGQLKSITKEITHNYVIPEKRDFTEQFEEVFKELYDTFSKDIGANFLPKECESYIGNPLYIMLAHYNTCKVYYETHIKLDEEYPNKLKHVITMLSKYANKCMLVKFSVLRYLYEKDVNFTEIECTHEYDII